MTKMTVDALLDRHMQAMAYKAITAQMGPSPQLIAFVNYENVSGDSVGLESFDFMSQHEAILAEIDSNDLLGMAMEGLGEKLKSMMEKVKNAITFNKANNLNDLVRSKLEVTSSNILVPSLMHINDAHEYAVTALKTLDYILSVMPKSDSKDGWIEFYNKQVATKNSSELGKKIAILERNWALYQEKGKKVNFTTAGWNESSFKKAIGDLGKLQNDAQPRLAKVADHAEVVRETLRLVESSHSQQTRDEYDRRSEHGEIIANSVRKKDDPDKKDTGELVIGSAVNEYGRAQRSNQHAMLMRKIPAQVTSAMSTVIYGIDTAVNTFSAIDKWTHKSLTDVSRHFKIKH